MSEMETVYVCMTGPSVSIWGRRPVKVEFPICREFESGDRFEIEGVVVEVLNVYQGKGGTQLEVTRV